jgi:hypothetical protein
VDLPRNRSTQTARAALIAVFDVVVVTKSGVVSLTVTLPGGIGETTPFVTCRRAACRVSVHPNA